MSKKKTTATQANEKRLSKRVERVGGEWKLLDDGNYLLTITHLVFPDRVVRGKWLTRLGRLTNQDFMEWLGSLEDRLGWQGYRPNSVTIKKDKLVNCGNPVCNNMFTKKNKNHTYCGDFCRGMMDVIKKRRSATKS